MKLDPLTDANDLVRIIPQRVVVCAALRRREVIICGPRHWDSICRGTSKDGWEQGFVDQKGVFLTREEAWPIAKAAGQIIRRVGGDEGRLYSENLY
jgi:hypothetical protein